MADSQLSRTGSEPWTEVRKNLDTLNFFLFDFEGWDYCEGQVPHLNSLAYSFSLWFKTSMTHLLKQNSRACKEDQWEMQM